MTQFRAMITFKAKVRAGFIDVPEFQRRHCDMPAFRTHAKYRELANSDLFPNVLRRIRRDLIGSDHRNYIKLDALPANVTVDQLDFLAVVSVSL